MRWCVGLRLAGSVRTFLTVIGVTINVGCGVLFGIGEFFWAGIVLIVANLFDMLDGNVARISGRVTKFGGFLDSSLDRISDMVAFLGIIAFYASNTPQHSLLNVILAGSRNDLFGDGQLYDGTFGRSGVKANVGFSATSGKSCFADNRCIVNLGLEF